MEQNAPPQEISSVMSFPSSIRKFFPAMDKWTSTPFDDLMSIPLSTTLFISYSRRGIKTLSRSVVSFPGMYPQGL